MTIQPASNATVSIPQPVAAPVAAPHVVQQGVGASPTTLEAKAATKIAQGPGFFERAVLAIRDWVVWFFQIICSCFRAKKIEEPPIGTAPLAPLPSPAQMPPSVPPATSVPASQAGSPLQSPPHQDAQVQTLPNQSLPEQKVTSQPFLSQRVDEATSTQAVDEIEEELEEEEPEATLEQLGKLRNIYYRIGLIHAPTFGQSIRSVWNRGVTNQELIIERGKQAVKNNPDLLSPYLT